MAVIEGGTTASLAEVDTTFLAMRVTHRPPQVIGWYSVAGSSGALTGAAAAAPVFSMRNTGANLLMIRSVRIGFIVTTAFTAAQGLAYGLLKANSFTVSDSGQTALYTAGANKHRNSFTNITSPPDIRISTTAAITAGTRTLETAPLVVAGGAASGLGAAMGITPLLSHDTGDYPLILAQNEGFIITNDILMGAIGVIRLMVNVEYAEVTAF